MKLENHLNVELLVSKTADMIDDSTFWKGNHFDSSRPYIGISIVAHPCSRYLWLNFRWFSFDLQEGRMLRLFRRGQREEEVVVEDLRDIGITLDHVLDKQLELDFGSHVKGHPDGLILSGVVEAPKAKHILEIKTHNNDSFQTLKKQGVKSAKPMHYGQMQCGMLGASILLGDKVERALYVAVNKNDDELYTERIRLDKPYAENLIKRGQDIATSDYMPSGCSTKADWWQCRMCRFHGFCHKKEEKLFPDINCRTCMHFTAEKDNTCTCACYGGAVLPLDVQRKGCECHVIHPDMVSWELIPEKSTRESAYYKIPGKSEVLNGWEGKSSKEIIASLGRGEDGTTGLSDESTTVNF